MIVIAVSSGTSVDAIDVAAARFRMIDVLRLEPLAHEEVPWPSAIRQRILAAGAGATTTVDEIAQLHTLSGQAFARAADAMAMRLGTRPDLVVSHGQTMYHWVTDLAAHGSFQIGEPAWIAELLGVPVVSNLRSRDIAAGGHGAPLASTLDALWLAEVASSTKVQRVAALNLGGIANATIHAPGELTSYDLGPGNCLIDEAATLATGGRERCDVDGALARQGVIDEDLLESLLADPYFTSPAPKSTGREYFTLRWVHRHRDQALPPVAGKDLVATMTELTARSVAAQLQGVELLVTSGGGVRNPTLMEALARHLPGCRVTTSAEFGLDPAAKEAYLFALLGYLTATGQAGTVRTSPGGRTTTGASGPRILGDITPGAGPLVLPPGAAEPPRRLRIG
ncbi:anhydro-N-acetylmuramic acid kinase [Segeticoccus rhizosphaerae]|jgi:anhydro-N-acetylmuramic acid kinase|uniref:anhydro-N-acetylmuramic acid kinase n=1 Tax=Segeticoccus rhizosphaerae TaxID=1104777 RepID=UPI0010C0A328|nr:anhydro-N-acetylmuramic acid kinase [Ornithinicoccus soli]